MFLLSVHRNVAGDLNLDGLLGTDGGVGQCGLEEFSGDGNLGYMIYRIYDSC